MGIAQVKSDIKNIKGLVEPPKIAITIDIDPLK